MANNKIYGTVIIVLLVLVLGLGGYIAYEKVFLIGIGTIKYAEFTPTICY